MNNSNIHSVKDNNRNLVFDIGEETVQGRITKFEPFNANMLVYFNNTRTNSVLITAIAKRAATRANATTAAPVATTSRSQQADAFAVLETKILAAIPEIRLEKTLKASVPKTLNAFLVLFFEEWNNEKSTIFVADKTVHTVAGRRRSLGDLFRICKYYFPQCTLRQLITSLYREIPTLLTDGFRTSYCSTIRKRVWYYAEGIENTVANSGQNDEYGNIVTWYTSKI